ncbi:claudin-3-like [Hemicordylus capensis]|uniref:claudin-3-like n=1 Tax=Hemicordylus capensis TaxID=884348 RepID=UPI002302914D|nr:claudin-3-like [Hemicordylus capensis]
MSMGLEIGGVSLATLGWVGCILSCALPMWRVTAFIGANIVTAQVTWVGLWMECVFQNPGQTQCKVYDSRLGFPVYMQASRALMVISIILGLLCILVFLMKARYVRCATDDRTRSMVTIAAGVVLLLTGLMTLIPVSWSASSIIRDFYSFYMPGSQKWELGASLYIGWAASFLLFFGGALLCCSCPPKEERYQPTNMVYSAPTSMMASYDKRNSSASPCGTAGCSLWVTSGNCMLGVGDQD